MAMEEVPDVFLLDIGIPGADGHELARWLPDDEKKLLAPCWLQRPAMRI
jgi:CheY-like chemotaxis protein